MNRSDVPAPLLSPAAHALYDGPMKTTIVRGDLLDQDVDVIVNAWNRNVIPWWLLLPQGISGAIKRRAGRAPFRELGRMGPIPLGGAVVTGAGRLPFAAIVHVAGIDLLWRASERSIRDAARNAVRLAEAGRHRSMAFPLIGAGSGRFDEEEALRILTEELESIDSEVEARIVRLAPPP